MADELPNFIAIRSIIGPANLVRYVKDDEQRRGYLRCDSESVFDPLCKIQVERSKTVSRYVHLRFVHVNKYWAKPANDRFLIADSDQPEEDLSKPTCTLILPSFTTNGNLSLRHVQSDRGIARDTTFATNNTDFLFAEHVTALFSFQFVDLDTVVNIPRHVAFKGYNDRYVGSVFNQGENFLRLMAEDPNADNSGYEIQQLRDGYVRIKSILLDRYWRWRANVNLIFADARENETGVNTLFWPVQIDNKTIALRSMANNNFINPSSWHGTQTLADCLFAGGTNIALDTRFVVEELVLQRDIYNVRYRMEDARIYDEEPFLAGVASATNLSNNESSLAITIAYEDSFTYSFTSSTTIIAGVESKIRVGLPKIASGQIRIYTEVTQVFEWNEVKEEKKTVTAQHNVTVPAKSRARVSYVGTQGKCSVPFNYTRRDKRSSNGEMSTSQHIDGIYTGVNYYNFQFEVMEIEPL